MIKYELEEVEETNYHNLYLIDNEHQIREFIGVIFEPAHSKIISRCLNDYVNREENLIEDL